MNMTAFILWQPSFLKGKFISFWCSHTLTWKSYLTDFSTYPGHNMHGQTDRGCFPIPLSRSATGDNKAVTQALAQLAGDCAQCEQRVWISLSALAGQRTDDRGRESGCGSQQDGSGSQSPCSSVWRRGRARSAGVSRKWDIWVWAQSTTASWNIVVCLCSYPVVSEMTFSSRCFVWRRILSVKVQLSLTGARVSWLWMYL